MGLDNIIQVGAGSQTGGLSRWATTAPCTTDTEPPTPGFTLGATPSSRTITQGQSTSFGATVTRQNGYTDDGTFSVTGLPANASGVFTVTVTPSGKSVGFSVTGCPSNTSCEFSVRRGEISLKVSTSRSAPVGTYTLVITGTSRTQEHTTSVTVNVK